LHYDPNHPLIDEPSGEALDLLRYFPPAGASAWLDAVSADLKGRSVDEAMTWAPAPGVTVRALYSVDDLPAAGAPLRYPSTPGWIACASAGHSADAGFSARLNAATIGGADALAIDAADGAWPATPLPLYLFSPKPLSEQAIPTSATGAYLWRLKTRPGALSTLIDACWPAASTVRRQAPGVRTLGVDITPFAHASLSVQLAISLALVRRHIDQGLATGWPLPAVLTGLQYALPLGRLFFPELARLRALPRLVGQIALAYDPGLRALPRLALLAETERCSGDDPHTHALRTTPMALAAVLGGCTALLVHPGGDAPAWDRLALNTHHVLRHEAYLGRVSDPAAGASYIEQLTDALARRAWRLFQILETSGDPDLTDASLHTLDAAS